MMRIDRIILNNFGSYEGETVFDTSIGNGRNIILVGGKNGAGKTTLFTAMRVCLYGYMSMGYKNYNAFYTRAISKQINNIAKLTKPTHASVAMQITLSNGRDLDIYDLSRSWVLDESLSETFSILKNGEPLSSGEVADFEKYLLSLIPPELFNLYFFDGEKIADFFMNEGSNARIKEAFLTLCGYDTFEIMRRNFKRISGGSAASTVALEEYLQAKQTAKEEDLRYQDLLSQLEACVGELDACEAEIAALEKRYTQSGGITQEEWNEKLIQLKEEEKKREVWNAVLKKWANEMVPFLIVRDQILALREQITAENDQKKYQSFCEILDVPEMSELAGDALEQMKTLASCLYGGETAPILDLSFEQCVTLLAQISTITDFDQSKIRKYRTMIKKSISRSAALRQELDNSSVVAVQDYMKLRAEMFERKSVLLNNQVGLEQAIAKQKEALLQSRMELSRTQSKLETDLKKASIKDISAKAILMLDKLQSVLYRQKIAKVEDRFRTEIRALMRKTKFIDDIRIDDGFNIYLYRNEVISRASLSEALQSNSEEQLASVIGEDAIVRLKQLSGEYTMQGLQKYCSMLKSDGIELPIRIDQASLSNGEKQIFIMALYHSLVQLGRHEIPFIIDTPFARIDTEHRHNISQHFFSKLKGQVFILSTNEEINSDHVQILKEHIAATYLLENTDNKRTVVVQDSYFEV